MVFGILENYQDYKILSIVDMIFPLIQLIDEEVKQITQLTQLKNLTLTFSRDGNVSLSNIFLSHINSLTNLKKLSLKGHYELGESSSGIYEKFTKLKNLDALQNYGN